jgi:ribosomal protein L7Ae-like RNA K-turn-binding protein
MDKTLNLLGIAKKAGLLAIGDESAGAAARAGKARAILSASDASDGSKRRAKAYAETCGAVHAIMPYDKTQLGMTVGRGTPGMLAILDAGLAGAFLKGMQERLSPPG